MQCIICSCLIKVLLRILIIQMFISFDKIIVITSVYSFLIFNFSIRRLSDIPLVSAYGIRVLVVNLEFLKIISPYVKFLKYHRDNNSFADFYIVIILLIYSRLSSCKAAIGILDRLSSSYQNEVEIIEESYHRLPSTLPHTVEQIEPTKVFLTKV